MLPLFFFAFTFVIFCFQRLHLWTQNGETYVNVTSLLMIIYTLYLYISHDTLWFWGYHNTPHILFHNHRQLCFYFYGVKAKTPTFQMADLSQYHKAVMGNFINKVTLVSEVPSSFVLILLWTQDGFWIFLNHKFQQVSYQGAVRGLQ